MEKINEFWSKLCQKLRFDKIKKMMTYVEGGKIRFRFETLAKVMGFLTTPLFGLYLYSSGVDSSYIGHSPTAFRNDSAKASNQPKSNEYEVHGSRSGSVVQGGQKTASQASGSMPERKLLAKQVLVREDSISGYGFTAGSNLVGELLSTIDTRDPAQIVRVVLPFGGRSNDGSSELPKGTLLMGQVSNQGKGEKVFINFQQAILPEGKAIKIAAIALDPRDYSTGLSGETQSQAKERTISVLGLAVASSIGDTLTEKEALGQGYNVTPKATMRNALLTGTSKAAEVEMNHIQEKTQAQDFIRVESGSVVIVSFTQGLSIE